MVARSEIWLKSAAGARVAILDEVARYKWTHKLNDIGELVVMFDPRGVDLDLLVEGVPIEVWRVQEPGGPGDGPNVGGTPYLEWEGLVTDTVDRLEGGAQRFELTAVSYLDLVARRVIAYPHGHARTIKNAVAAETILKEFVEHNVAASATTGGGRYASGVTSGFTVQLDGGNGPALSGQGTLVPLLPLLQRVAAASASQGSPTTIDFDVVGTGASGGVQTFEFRTFIGGRGADRSSPAAAGSHLNAAGRRPLIFNPELGNLAAPVFRQSPRRSKNRVYGIGRGVFDNQIVQVADNASGQAATLGLREMVHNAEEAQDNDAVEDAAEAQLAAAKGSGQLDGDLLQLGEALYGRDYELGDTVTLRFRDFEQARRLAAVEVVVQDGQEEVRFELSEPPTDAPS